MRWLATAAALLLIPVGAAGALGRSQPPITGWLSFGNGAARTGASSAPLDVRSLESSWTRSVDGMDTVQPLVAHNVPARGQTTAYVATGDGHLLAYAPNGYLRWQRNLGTLPNPCPQLDEYGITGTPVIDARTRAIYVADAFGFLHALDLASGTERQGLARPAVRRSGRRTGLGGPRRRSRLDLRRHGFVLRSTHGGEADSRRHRRSACQRVHGGTQGTRRWRQRLGVGWSCVQRQAGCSS